jgi:hypothetical protein
LLATVFAAAVLAAAFTAAACAATCADVAFVDALDLTGDVCRVGVGVNVVPVVAALGVVEEPTGVVVTGAGVAHTAGVIVSVSSVTAPPLARTRPPTETFVVTVTLADASIWPTKVDPVPSVAELPTCQ